MSEETRLVEVGYKFTKGYYKEDAESFKRTIEGIVLDVALRGKYFSEAFNERYGEVK